MRYLLLFFGFFHGLTTFGQTPTKDTIQIHVLDESWILYNNYPPLSGFTSYYRILEEPQEEYLDLDVFFVDKPDNPNRSLITLYPDESLVGITIGYAKNCFIRRVTLLDSNRIGFSFLFKSVSGQATQLPNKFKTPDIEYFVWYNLTTEEVEAVHPNLLSVGMEAKTNHLYLHGNYVSGCVDDTITDSRNYDNFLLLPHYIGKQYAEGIPIDEGQISWIKKIGNMYAFHGYEPKAPLLTPQNRKDSIATVLCFDTTGGFYTALDLYDFYWVNSLTQKGHYANPYQTSYLRYYTNDGTLAWEVEAKGLENSFAVSDKKESLYILQQDFQLIHYDKDQPTRLADIREYIPNIIPKKDRNVALEVSESGLFITCFSMDDKQHCLKLDTKGKLLWQQSFPVKKPTEQGIKWIDGALHWCTGQEWETGQHRVRHDKVLSPSECGFWYKSEYHNGYLILNDKTGEIQWGGYLPIRDEAPLGQLYDGRILVSGLFGWMLFRPNMEE